VRSTSRVSSRSKSSDTTACCRAFLLAKLTIPPP
jgi:hypothetical protein